MMGEPILDSIFMELEKEIGEAIPHAVVEAQRRFARSGLYSLEEMSSEEDLRKLLALYGLGELKEMSTSDGSLCLSLENAAYPLMLVGLLQGIFETSISADTNVDWELSENRNLDIEILRKP